MREIVLNGYIDECEFFGDEITPEKFHEELYGLRNEHTDDVHIRLNSYGGSCNAAVRIYDDIRAYPGAVHITISGTAASAATVVCMAADKLEITRGSLYMIHNPSMIAFGNESDMCDAIKLLRACKESILNIYECRARVSREDVSAMMDAATWMDANEAFENGFVDAIAENPAKAPIDYVTRENAEKAVNAWLERKHIGNADKKEISAENSLEIPQEEPNEPTSNRVKITEIDTRLEHLRY